MRTRNLVRMMAALCVAAAVADGAPEAPVRAASPLTPVGSAESCTALTSLALKDVAISSATVVRATGRIPEFCNIVGTLERTITFRVAMPISAWNGKFFLAGGGGFNGTVPNLDQALARGYAAAGSDTGHQGQSLDASWALDNPKAQLDYAHRATHVVTRLGKQIVTAFYDRMASRSYFVGCSNGGKMGLMEVLRYPDDFDGVVIGNFVTDRTRLMMDYTWNAQALDRAPIPPVKLPVLERATLQACDARDGLKDGLVDRPDLCHVDLKTITCEAGDRPDCLTAGQAAAVEKLWTGARRPDGSAIFPGFLPGHEDDYANFLTGDGTRNGYPSSTWKLQDGFMRFFAFGPAFDSVKSFDFATSPDRLKPLVADQDAGPPAMESFKAHGGRLIMYHGWADHSIPPTNTVEYYGQLRARFADADSFARLFMAPGLHHCTGGPGPNVFGGANQGYAPVSDAAHDVVASLDRWVEEGVAPESIVATKYVADDPAKGIARTRPLCRYPLMATYTGQGSLDDSANFTCARPKQ